MSVRINLGLGLLAVTVFGAFTSPSAEAASADCMSAEGTCEVTNDPDDFITCECADGAGTGGTGGNEWEGLSDEDLQPICEAELDGLCGGGGPPPPPIGTFCEGPQGFCEISNEPEDALFCECADGSGGGFGGGMDWAGLSDDELEAICLEELPNFCGGMAGLPCATESGSCIISNEPFDSINCECADGEGFGFGGGMDWAGLSNDELIMVCEETLDLECEGGPPPLPGLECSNELGTCSIANEPVDSIACECVNGAEPAGGGGMDWAGQSEEELLVTCEMELNVLCAEGGETESTSTTAVEPTTGEPGTTTDVEPGTTTDVEPGTTTDVEPGTTTDVEPGTTTAVEGSGTGGGPGTTGSTPPDSADGTGTGSGGADGGDGGGGCSVATERAPGGGVLMLLGLLGLGWRRRRAA